MIHVFSPDSRRSNLHAFQEGALNTAQGGTACESHGADKFGVEDFQDVLNACRAVDGQSPENRAGDQDRTGTKGQGFEDVGAAPDAAVAVDFAAVSYRVDDFRQHFDTGNAAIELAPSMVGDNDGGDTILKGQQGIFGGEKPLEDDGQGCDGTQ